MSINGNLSWERFIKAAVAAASTAYEPVKNLCKSTGEACELATEFGYCKVTACTRKHIDTKTEEA